MSPKYTTARHFDRWKPALGKTWAFRLFQRHHTEINDLYWSHVAAFQRAFKACRGKQRTDACSTVFGIRQNPRRLPATLGDWADQYNGFNNWTRLSLLVAATGYLEVYMKTAVRLALESDPALIVGCPRKVDGVEPLKRKVGYSYSDEAIPCVKGEWQSRVAAYTRLFGTCPQVIHDNISELEFMRKTRNGVAHTFGRGADDYNALAQAKPRQLTVLSEDRFTKILGLTEEVGKALEAHLSTHIGDYESVYFFHHWLNDDPFALKTDKALRVAFVQLHNNTVGKPYCTELRSLYDKY